jgi:hypothetical protein
VDLGETSGGVVLRHLRHGSHGATIDFQGQPYDAVRMKAAPDDDLKGSCISQNLCLRALNAEFLGRQFVSENRLTFPSGVTSIFLVMRE